MPKSLATSDSIAIAAETTTQKRRGRLLTAILLVAVGIPGILTLLLSLPSVPGIPRAAMLINPIVLLVAGALVGSWLAPRCGYNALVAGNTGGLDRKVWRKAIGYGALLGAALATLDHLGRPVWLPKGEGVPSMIEAGTPTGILTGVLYGGITEEIIMRWGLMSVLTWVLWRVLFRSQIDAPRAAKIAALLGAAVLFAAAHIPALVASGASLEPMLLARTLILNSVAGVLFGAFFLRYHLEAAITSHIAFHVGVGALSYFAIANS